MTVKNDLPTRPRLNASSFRLNVIVTAFSSNIDFYSLINSVGNLTADHKNIFEIDAKLIG